jgi:methylated-DNA-[protein]-cysteine S-methyltransferase
MKSKAKSSTSTDTVGYQLFEIPFGTCAIAWRDRTIVRTFLPEATTGALVSRIGRLFPGAALRPAPSFVARAVAVMVAEVGARDRRAQTPMGFASVPLALDDLPPFRRRVYEALRHVPRGTTVTYGQLAARAGSAGGARAVGQAMAKNPFPLLVPCHRVLASTGAGGFSAHDGERLKKCLLEAERLVP